MASGNSRLKKAIPFHRERKEGFFPTTARKVRARHRSMKHSMKRRKDVPNLEVIKEENEHEASGTLSSICSGSSVLPVK